MHENHYYESVLCLATELVNQPPEHPTSIAARWNELGLGIDAVAGQADLDEVRRFLEKWSAVIDADSEDQRVLLINEILAEAAAYPRITNHDGSAWHLHYCEDDASLGTVIRVVIAVAAAKHLTMYGMHRLGRCALRDCRLAFMDLTRGGRQRYCARLCANRDAVRRHRANAKNRNAALARSPKR